MNQKKHQPVMCAGICLDFMMSDLFSPYTNYEVLHEERELQTSQEILEEYRHADRKRRCDIWLMFPALREKFDDIGRDHMQAGGFCCQKRGSDPVRDSIDDIDDSARRA